MFSQPDSVNQPYFIWSKVPGLSGEISFYAYCKTKMSPEYVCSFQQKHFTIRTSTQELRKLAVQSLP